MLRANVDLILGQGDWAGTVHCKWCARTGYPCYEQCAHDKCITKTHGIHCKHRSYNDA